MVGEQERRGGGSHATEPSTATVSLIPLQRKVERDTRFLGGGEAAVRGVSATPERCHGKKKKTGFVDNLNHPRQVEAGPSDFSSQMG